MTSYTLDCPPTCLVSLKDGQNAVAGCVDGSVRVLNVAGEELEEDWIFQLKAAVRGLELNESDNTVYAVTKNRGLSVFDLETGKRTRCIKRAHDAPPTAVCTMPHTSLKNQQLATADEEGQVRTWDLRADSPTVRTWHTQEKEDINDLKIDERHNLLAASSDGTVTAFDVRKGKLKVRSEAMHSELHSICVTSKYAYVGGADGHIEVFKMNEYGNLLERIESGFDMVVSGIVELRKGLLLTSSSTSNKLRLLNVMPNKRLGLIGTHGEEDDGVDFMALSADKSTLFTGISMESSIKKWDIAKLIEKVPILRATDAKRKETDETFFDDMFTEEDKERRLTKRMRKSKKVEDSDEDENSTSGVSEDEQEDEEDDDDESGWETDSNQE